MAATAPGLEPCVKEIPQPTHCCPMSERALRGDLSQATDVSQAGVGLCRMEVTYEPEDARSKGVE
jgi:hypothetical protein